MSDWNAEAIRATLAAVAARDRKFAEFGSRAHRYRLNRVLSVAKVTAFERRHGIALPADYRDFLLQVGNGGAGPHYGLYRLGTADSHDADLATPFPHTSQWRPAPDDEDVDRWYDGTMEIAECGCAYYHRLVVTGPASGQVWQDLLPCDQGIVPEAGFRDWYLTWLAELAARHGVTQTGRPLSP
ncbi:SMI1/KNR4 family protein [Crossiella sp. SN42]|uniref:SMI1/KNR4 family protein n=1 Tax=Crossiella sp. SN42 TaxID=2944808 RepID=UPI00207CF716|nr:SMI1/KNR4 family protein [Crossiella sp. SN42]MCO1581122.1 SMI1/KNR4 family protein [Crossiella sp. SN42]